MTFTKEQISKMKEEEFQNTVLIPLFRKMGFRDVTPFGGGNLELGKDIIMWKPDDLGQRVNYGVVVKAKKITGNAETSEGAMNVLNQVRQMLKTSYSNPVTGKSEYIERCFVACSKEIGKEAMNSIKGELENNFDKLVRWIHPKTNLYDLIEKYLPEQDVFEKLSEVQKNLDEQMKDTPYKIIGDSNGQFHIVGKHEKAHEEMPFEFEVIFQWNPNTEEGKEFYERLKKHIEKGTPIEIEGKYIKSVEFPKWLPEWIKPTLSKDAKLILGSTRSLFSFPLKFERRLTNGEVISLQPIEMEMVQQGSEEFTLKNDRQKVPYQFALTFNKQKGELDFRFNYKFMGFNVFQHLQGLRFYEAMFKEGPTAIYRSDINVKIVDSLHKIRQSNKNKLEDFARDFQLLEALVLIQEKTSTSLILPDRKILPEEYEDIFQVEEIIKTGKLNSKLTKFTSNVELEKAKETLEKFSSEKVSPMFFRYESWKSTILGKEIDLGIAVITFDAFIEKDDFELIQNSINKSEQIIDLIFTPVEKNWVIDFLKWDCEDRHTRLEIG